MLRSSVRSVSQHDWRTAVASWQRWVRLIRLCLHVLRMWLGALLLGGRINERWREPIVRRFSEQLLAILGIRIDVRGAVPSSAWPVLMVSNHVSWLDTYVVNAFHGARFVAKSEVARWPVIGTIARRFGTLFIVRQSIRSAARTKDAVAALLRRGIPVAVFPEGTTTDGRTVLKFHTALLQAAIDANVPVQPVAIAYRGRDGRRTTAAAFIDDLSILSSLRQILREDELVAEVTFCQPLSSRGQTRREVARRTRRTVADALDIQDTVVESDRFASPQPASPGESWQRLRNALRMAHGSVARG